MKLLPSQKVEFFKAIKASGLPKEKFREFESSGESEPYTVSVTGTDFYVEVHYTRGRVIKAAADLQKYWLLTFSPGLLSYTESLKFNLFEDVLPYAEAWALRLRQELSIADPWGIFDNPKRMEDMDEIPLDSGELLILKRWLNETKQALIEQGAVNQDEINRRFDEIEHKAGKVGRKELVEIVASTLFSLAFTNVISSEAAKFAWESWKVIASESLMIYAHEVTRLFQ